MANIKISEFANKAGNFVGNDKLTLLDSQDAYSNKNKTFTGLITSLSDFASTIRTGIDVYSTSQVDALVASSISIKTADYASLDDDGISHVIFDFSAGNKKMLNYTTPALANNLNRKIKISTYGNGILKINREGSSNILLKGTALTAMYLYCSGNFVEIEGSSLGWIITSKEIYIDTSWVVSTEIRNKDFGLKTVTYDGLSGTFAVGERVTINNVTNAGIIVSDTGAVLTLYSCSNAQNGLFTNDWTIAGAQSGATANVNGANTNAYGNILHSWGLNGIDLDYIFYVNASASFTNAMKVADVWGSSTSCNAELIQVDTNNVKFQTGNAGIYYAKDADGSAGLYTTGTIYLYLRVFIL